MHWAASRTCARLSAEVEAAPLALTQMQVQPGAYGRYLGVAAQRQAACRRPGQVGGAGGQACNQAGR
jgi:hypothetical protein